ncbi:MAG: transcriptional regulator, partial [Spirochaetota bacterium]
MSDVYVKHEANDDFSKARNRETISKILSLLNPSRQEMLSLREVREVLRPKSESYRGLQVVPLDRIVGSEGRYADFNKQFLPRHEHLRKRWTRVDEAHLTQVNLPPIRLYEIGGVYFVRDGNHRVSVARSQGGKSIDAEVISLDSAVELDPDLTRDKLKQAVIEYEKRQFNRQTRFDKIFPEYDLKFTATGRYDEVLQHIYGHKYYININYQEEIPFEAAMRSWYTNVFMPIIGVIREQKLLSRFPGRTEPDLYVWLVKHWDELKRRYGGEFTLAEAAEDLSNRFGKSLWAQLREYMQRRRAERERKKKIAT